MSFVEQPVVRIIPDQSLTEAAVHKALEQLEEHVAKEASLASVPAGEFLQVVVYGDVGWNTALAEYKSSTDATAFVAELLKTRRHLVMVTDPDRDQKPVEKAVQLDVTLYGDEQSSSIVARKAGGAGPTIGASAAPERTTLLLQRQWGFLSTQADTRADQLVAIATLAMEGWRLEADGQTIELASPGAPALEWAPRDKSGLTRPRTTLLAIYFKGLLTPPIAMQAGWGSIGPDGSRTVALSTDASGAPQKLSFAPVTGGRGAVALSAPGWRASQGVMVPVAGSKSHRGRSDFRGSTAPSRVSTPSLMDWRSNKLKQLDPTGRAQFLAREQELGWQSKGVVCPLFVHHDLSGSAEAACLPGRGCMLTSRPGFDPSMSYVPCMTPHTWAQNTWSGGNAWQGGRAGGKGSDQGGEKPTKGGGKPAAANNVGQGGGKPTEGGGKPAAAYDGGRGGGKPTTGGGKPVTADVGDGGRGRGATSVAGAH